MASQSGGNPFARFAFASAAGAAGKRERERSSAKKARSSDEAASGRRLALLRALLQARGEMETPVDRFGTQACVFPAAGGRARRFQLLVAALLSAQTRDEVTFAAMQRLHAASGGDEGLTVASALATPEQALSDLLRPVGFYRRKARQVRRVAAVLRARFDADVPPSLAELEALPGVGPKVARVALLLAWGRADGIAVDTHVHRLAQRFGWSARGQAGEAPPTPEHTRRELEAWVPREHWLGLSRALVGFGQAVCTAERPKCAACPVANLCPSANAPWKQEARAAEASASTTASSLH